LLATIQLYHTSPPLANPLETKSPPIVCSRGLFFASGIRPGGGVGKGMGVSIGFRNLTCSKAADQLSHKTDALNVFCSKSLCFFTHNSIREPQAVREGVYLNMVRSANDLFAAWKSLRGVRYKNLSLGAAPRSTAQEDSAVHFILPTI
jgi:hypothetical protein